MRSRPRSMNWPKRVTHECDSRRRAHIRGDRVRNRADEGVIDRCSAVYQGARVQHRRTIELGDRLQVIVTEPSDGCKIEPGNRALTTSRTADWSLGGTVAEQGAPLDPECGVSSNRVRVDIVELAAVNLNAPTNSFESLAVLSTMKSTGSDERNPIGDTPIISRQTACRNTKPSPAHESWGSSSLPLT